MRFILVIWIGIVSTSLFSQKQYLHRTPSESLFNYSGSAELDNGNIVSCFRNRHFTFVDSVNIFCTEMFFYYYDKDLNPIDTFSFTLDCDPHLNNYINSNIVKSGGKIYFASGLWDEIEYHHAGHRIISFDPITKNHEILATSLDTLGSKSALEWILYMDSLTNNLVLFKSYNTGYQDLLTYNITTKEQVRIDLHDPGLLAAQSLYNNFTSGIAVSDGFIYFLDNYISKYNLLSKEFSHKIANSRPSVSIISYSNNCRIIDSRIISIHYTSSYEPITQTTSYKLSSLSYTLQDKPEDIILKDIDIVDSPCSYPTLFTDDLGPAKSGHFTAGFTHRGLDNLVCTQLGPSFIGFETYYGIFIFDDDLNICDTIKYKDGHTEIMLKNQVSDSIVAIGGYKAIGSGFNDPDIEHYSFVRFININQTCAKELSAQKHPPLSMSKVFPNPTNGLLKIEMEGPRPEFILIFNSIGAKIKKVPFSENTIDLGNLENGVYFYKALNHQGVVTHIGKFVKI